jgi:hypothetical protein
MPSAARSVGVSPISPGFVKVHSLLPPVNAYVLILNEILIPLPPIAFYSQSYCLEKEITYLSEHERVVAYLTNLNLEDYIGSHDSRDVVVLTDSGYDNKHIGLLPTSLRESRFLMAYSLPY